MDSHVLYMDVSTSRFKNKVTMLDKDSLDLVANGNSWYTGGTEEYPYVHQRLKKTFTQLHRLVMGLPEGSHVDHKNGNTLDNRAENLRVCSQYENMRNSKVQKNNKVGLKGVTGRVHVSGTGFTASLLVNGKQVHLGTFKNPLDAAYAYDMAALKYYGGFAKTNRMQGLFELDFDELFPASERHKFIEVSLEMQNTYGFEVAA